MFIGRSEWSPFGVMVGESTSAFIDILGAVGDSGEDDPWVMEFFRSRIFLAAAPTGLLRKLSFLWSWEPRFVCLSRCRAHRSCRTNDRLQSGKSQKYICFG